LKQILLLTSEFPPGPGGIGRHSEDLANYFYSKNYKVTVYSAYRPEFVTNGAHPYEVVRYSISSNPLLKFGGAFSILWKHRGAQAVFFSGMAMVFMAAPTALISRSKRVIILHGHEPRMLTSWRKWLFMQSCSLANHIVGVSHFAISTLVEARFRVKLRVIPNGININQRYLPKSNSAKTVKLITVGSVSLRKGQHNVVAAMKVLLKEFPGLEYHVIGQFKEKDMDQIKSVTGLSVFENVYFHGVLLESDKEKWLSSSTIFIMLSENQSDGDVEGFGIAVLEANLQGLPSIGSKGTGLEQSISHGNSGLLIDAKDPEALLSSINEILHRYEEFSQGAIKWALQHDVKKMAEQYLNLVEE
jgi:phosphatidyl-myo-inositol dimannoside synthase